MSLDSFGYPFGDFQLTAEPDRSEEGEKIVKVELITPNGELMWSENYQPKLSFPQHAQSDEILADRLGYFRQYSRAMQPQALLRATPEERRILYLLDDRRIDIVLADGTKKTLMEADMDGPVLKHADHYFEYQGQHYLILFARFDNQHAQQIFIVREDGQSISIEGARVEGDLDQPFGPQPNQLRSIYTSLRFIPPELWLEDGILQIHGTPYELDLHDLENTANVALADPGTVDIGDEDVPVEQIIEKYFVDLSHSELKTYETDIDENLIEQLAIDLNKKDTTSSVILGPAGTGKTNTVRAFAKRVRKGEVPGIPRTTRIFQIDASSLVSGTKYTGTFDARVEAITKMSEAAPCIWIIDEIHQLKGAGTSEKNSQDVWQRLKPYMADGRVRIIGTSTSPEYYEAYGDDEALLQRISERRLQEPNQEQTIRRLNGWLESHGHEQPPEQVMRELVRISEEANSTYKQPRKAAQLLDTTASMLTMQGRRMGSLSSEDLRLAAEKEYGLPSSRFDASSRTQALEKLKVELNQWIIGYDELKQDLYDLTAHKLSGLPPRRGRVFSVLIAGVRGTGKTVIPRIYAEAMGYHFHRINIGELQSLDAFLNEVAQAIERDPFAVILFDEFDKASPAFQDALLKLLDTAQMTLRPETRGSNGHIQVREMDVQHAHFFFAGNAGENYLKNAGGRSFLHSNQEFDIEDFRAKLEQEGASGFLLDRVSAVFPAQALDEDNFVKVLKLQVRTYQDELKKAGYQVEFDPTKIDQLLNELKEKHFEHYQTHHSLRAVIEEIRGRLNSEIVANQNCSSSMIKLAKTI